ncbi:GIY-YIG catalytic domain containing protein [Verticillium alfalfae VaMs.102]|uniref:GIY-YIG catalytic domain containing protein n=1 Tax=Verticillium alfalfae (strain VaMs.102 / ATCC MYA-4576 / FGSC 10136) TaxID=526221 RepID=C9SRR2_VERA1|nr:GIY-YIG catalytic domain containing protein [Verticillium alfalfae VaMs.102]EEY21477.1 GIY-YIG catalytic domain containing protein [Verticillium alfalfae VaMs.102]
MSLSGGDQQERTEDQDGEDDDGEEKIYNPLKLPLSWDGKPIPYWLYRLHGLGVEFPCEICGNFVYMGRRAFDKHFNEARHVHGLRCLGITNTSLFRDITSIEQATNLWEKIQREAKKNKVDDGSIVQMEDGEGNVMPEKGHFRPANDDQPRPPSLHPTIPPSNAQPSRWSIDDTTRAQQDELNSLAAMAVLSRPIPALYTVYILRSTVRHASLYIGSTPNPPRRLKQHNGLARGGAARTSRSSLRPWEMIAIVSGFPSMIAALKFEWALTNPHLSLHIPSESRISRAAGVKKNGHPKRPRPGITSIMSNLHLLLRVPSFERWPLTLHFFVKTAHKAWEGSCAAAEKPVRKGLEILTDFGPSATMTTDPLEHGKGLHVICSNGSCEGAGHLSCWSRHLLDHESGDEAVLPVAGRCPSCRSEVRWDDLMRELSLRVRGEGEVDKLLKVKKKRQAKT